MGLLHFIWPFAATVSLHILLAEMFSTVVHPGRQIAAALATFFAGLLVVLAFRHWYGRQSPAAYLMLIATVIPLTTGGFEIGDLVTGGGSILDSALVATPIMLLILTMVERLLYTPDERKALRAITSFRANPSEKPE